MNDMKQEFLFYLRSVYQGQPAPVMEGGFPPLQVSTVFPAFRQAPMNEALGMLAGQQPGMGMGMQPSGMGGGMPPMLGM
mgnify:CR=1 FL=1